MAASTTDVLIKPTDGWTLVATNPTYLRITPHDNKPWFVAITAGSAPAATLVGGAMRTGDEKESFEITSLTGTVYVRAGEHVDATGRGLLFGVLSVT